MTQEPGGTLADNPLHIMLGGWRGIIETTVPPLAFVGAYAATGGSLAWAVGLGVAASAVLAIWRVVQGERPTRVLGALLLVVIAAIYAAYTGSAVAYFWPLVLANVASALIFAFSILIRWPLIGVILGPVVGTGKRWRQDPDLLRAYSRASWLWVLLNLVRAVVQVPLIKGDALWALAAVRPVFYLLVLVTVIASWAVIQRTLPEGHPGVRRPQPATG